ncbi:ribosomal RNA small subunit methyltransferase B [Arenicella chitinivorans]|uniref:16S rRNA (cytosine(967)-C(5))-methyltransferase n=1 Tax=Arenicella chitinivorans TaxID=1329800 RepID=A0A918S1M4_9GAMM|nr:16S rRNA (cytosine(967)-C(5))-methyltransferase RsmB [Arenicella chitinivorans]GHA20066.1 ribosomal RNA small subunit methyltransferase B [Arenicella chitinivorans]
MASRLNTRAAAAQIAWQIIDKGQSLDACLSAFFEQNDFSPQDRGFVQELVYGVCRWHGELDWVASQLLQSPIRKKDRVVHFVLLVGLYQQRHLDTAAHAAVSETVSACQQLGKQWAKKLINGCLRSAQRTEYTLPQDVDSLCHPAWIRDAIIQAWPQHATAILSANNARPPMCLRVNSMRSTRTDYLARLTEQKIAATPDPFARDGIILTQPTPVTNLPDFSSGACSVQDTAAQIAADLLAPQPGMTVLDACAAPGGKTAHLLERCDNDLQLDALDISASRCLQLQATLDRLQLTAKVTTADASDATQWPPSASGYDRILIDAPCSGLGVIRRHPDIKHHRRPQDIDQLTQIQAALLDALWLQLKPGGRLLYMTCSVLPAENHLQIDQFVRRQKGVMLPAVPHPNALQLEHGVQTLPGVHAMDGFYYCLLEKTLG